MVVGTVVVSTLSGYAFGTMRFAGENVLFYLLLSGLVIPFEAVIVPLYVELRAGHLTNSYWSVILPLIGMNSAFGTFWMRAYFRGVPRQLLEAAAMDGAGSLRILWKVLLPGARPALLTLVVLVFMWSWNEFLLPLVMLSREDLRTAPLGLAFFAGRYTTDLRRHGRRSSDGRAAGGRAVHRDASALRARHVGGSLEAMTARSFPQLFG